MIKLSFLSGKISKCCVIDSLPISLCSDIEKNLIEKLFPNCNSIIVLAHHIKSTLEWAWFPFESERNNLSCAADLHMKLECSNVVSKLESIGYRGEVVPYPGRCGIKFKDIANKTGLGKIGDNFMFLHKEWGVWVHLRVILTDAEISDTLPICEEICNHCGLCKSACPAKVIREDTLLGVECSQFQTKRDSDIGMEGSYIYKCCECAYVCPIGDRPEKILISKY